MFDNLLSVQSMHQDLANKNVNQCSPAVVPSFNGIRICYPGYFLGFFFISAVFFQAARIKNQLDNSRTRQRGTTKVHKGQIILTRPLGASIPNSHDATSPLSFPLPFFPPFDFSLFNGGSGYHPGKILESKMLVG